MIKKYTILILLFLLGACEAPLPQEVLFAEGRLVVVDEQWEGLLFHICYTSHERCLVGMLHPNNEHRYWIKPERIKIKGQINE